MWIQLRIVILPSDMLYYLRLCSVDYGCLRLYSPTIFYHTLPLQVNRKQCCLQMPS